VSTDPISIAIKINNRLK